MNPNGFPNFGVYINPAYLHFLYPHIFSPMMPIGPGPAQGQVQTQAFWDPSQPTGSIQLLHYPLPPTLADQHLMGPQYPPPVFQGHPEEEEEMEEEMPQPLELGEPKVLIQEEKEEEVEGQVQDDAEGQVEEAVTPPETETPTEENEEPEPEPEPQPSTSFASVAVPAAIPPPAVPGPSCSSKRRSALIRYCKFCRSNKENKSFYMSHDLRDEKTKIVICPVLRSYVCQICHATGDDAHTFKYCPFNPFVPSNLMGYAHDELRQQALEKYRAEQDKKRMEAKGASGSSSSTSTMEPEEAVGSGGSGTSVEAPEMGNDDQAAQVRDPEEEQRTVGMQTQTDPQPQSQPAETETKDDDASKVYQFVRNSIGKYKVRKY